MFHHDLNYIQIDRVFILLLSRIDAYGYQTLLKWKLESNMGSFSNYVDRILQFFYPTPHPHLLGQFLYPLRGQKQTYFDPLPPSSCPRSYWMAPMGLFCTALFLLECYYLVSHNGAKSSMKLYFYFSNFANNFPKKGIPISELTW